LSENCASSTPSQLPNENVLLPSSTGNVLDIHTMANDLTYCCVGSVGAMVKSSTSYLLLSNAHVYAPFSVANPVRMQNESLRSPGLGDVNCVAAQTTQVATLRQWSNLASPTLHYTDAALGQLDWSSALYNLHAPVPSIGAINPQVAPAFPSMLVQKHGRTTGRTHGYVYSISNNEIFVGYETACNSGDTFTRVFTDQIIIASVNSDDFSRGGDSGSLIVTDSGQTPPQPVGLLFAGNTDVTVANQIQNVLDEFNVEFFDFGASVGAQSTEKRRAQLEIVATNKQKSDAILQNATFWHQVKEDSGENYIGHVEVLYEDGEGNWKAKEKIWVSDPEKKQQVEQDVADAHFDDVEVEVEVMPPIRAFW